jgi:HAMP domain-containing protein
MGKAKTGPSTLQGSRKAKQCLVVILETLGGACTTGEAAERLGVSLSRYYQLETRALQGMLTALEPRPRGPKKTKDSEIRALKAEKREMARELRRATSLLRAATRSVGAKAAKPQRKKGAKKKRRRAKARGATVLATIRENEEVAHGRQEPGGAAATTDLRE